MLNRRLVRLVLTNCSSCPDRNGSIVTQLQTPSPSHSRKTFFRQSDDFDKWHSADSSNKGEKPLALYPITPKPLAQFEFRHEVEPNPGCRAPPRSTFAAHVEPSKKQPTVLPNAWIADRTTSLGSTGGSPFQPEKEPIEVERVHADKYEAEK